MFLQRPKPGEDENNLLEFQAQFLASGEKPSVKVISCQRKNQKEIEKDVHQLNQDLKTPARKSSAKQIPFTNKDIEAEMDHYDTHITAVLSDMITEREVNFVPTFPGPVDVANPQATRRPRLRNFQKNLSRSMFALQYGKEKKVHFDEDAEKSTNETSQKLKPIDMCTSSRAANAVGGRDVLQAIHMENVNKLNSMSVEDIKKQKEKLKASLGLQTVAFIKRRGGNSTLAEGEPTCKAQDSRSSQEHDPSHVSIDGTWINMNYVEKEKMRWMELMNDTRKNKEVDLPNRFGFEGSLLSLEQSYKIPSYVGLHHHGNEPDLAGYTLQELISLSQSSFPQQRIFALKLLARIIDKDKQGDYGRALPGPVLPLLVGAGVAFIFRWALDEHSESGIQAAVDGISSLLTPMSTQISLLDEILLSYRGYEFPSLQSESSIIAKETKEESDFQLISRDLVLGYVRMDILSRIRYILEICHPEASVVHKCLGILIRISQHSASVAMRVLDCPRLIKYIVVQYLASGCPGNSKATFHRHRAEALRLLRTICMSGRHAAARLINDHAEIKVSVFSVLTGHSSHERQVNRTVHVGASELETWRLWTVFVSYGIGIGWFRDSTPILMECFQTCVQLVSRPCDSESLFWIQHVTKFLASVLTNLSRPSVESHKALYLDVGEVNGFYPVLTTLLGQTVQASLERGCIQEDLFGAVACTFDAVATFYSKGANLFNISSGVVDVVVIMQSLQAQVLEFQDSLMVSFSGSLSPFPFLPQPCVGGSSENDFSIIRKQRYITAFMRCSVMMVRANKKMCSYYTSFLADWRARDALGRLITPELSPSTRLVCHAIYWLVKLFVITSLEHTSLKSLASYFHSLALSCLSFLPPGEECWSHDLLSNVIFNPIMMRDISGDAPDEFPRLCSIYISCVGFSLRYLHKSMHWEETSSQLPLSIMQQCKSSLIFLLFLEKYRLDFWMRVPNTLKITRLMCLFMAGSDIFLDGTVRSLLDELFRLYCRNDINFKQAAEGIVSFYDFYMALLDQYEAVSYGDSLFSSVVLLPLTQDGDKQCKMALWAEHGDAIRYIGIRMDQILLPEELYLSPSESDYDVIRAYLRALVNGKCVRHSSPFLHKVALHHILEYYKVHADEEKRKEISTILHRVSGLNNVLLDHSMLHT